MNGRWITHLIPPNPQASSTNPQPTYNPQSTPRNPSPPPRSPSPPSRSPSPPPRSPSPRSSQFLTLSILRKPQAISRKSKLIPKPKLIPNPQPSKRISPAPDHVQIKLCLVEVFHNPVSVLKFRCTCSIKSSDYNTSVQRNLFLPSFYDEESVNKGLCEFLICCDDMELKSPLKLLGSEVIEIEMSKNFTLDICFLQHTKPRDQQQQKLCQCKCHLRVKRAKRKI